MKAKIFNGINITILHRGNAGSSVLSLCALFLGIVQESAQYGLFSHASTQWGILSSSMTLCSHFRCKGYRVLLVLFCNT